MSTLAEVRDFRSPHYLEDLRSLENQIKIALVLWDSAHYELLGTATDNIIYFAQDLALDWGTEHEIQTPLSEGLAPT